jgi:hypothetical protein
MNERDVIPRKDTLFDIFQDNLVVKCNANMVNWNIPQPELDKLNSPQVLWNTTWNAAKNKNNRTAAQVAAKDLARHNYEEVLRDFIQAQLYRNDSVTANDLVECGLRPRDTVRTPVPVPESVPIINVTLAAGNIMAVRFFRLDDEDGAIRRGKPNGVTRVEFAYNVTVEPASPQACEFHTGATASPIKVNVPPTYRGQKIWFYARWVNTRDQAGPWTNLDFVVL